MDLGFIECRIGWEFHLHSQYSSVRLRKINALSLIKHLHIIHKHGFKERQGGGISMPFLQN